MRQEYQVGAVLSVPAGMRHPRRAQASADPADCPRPHGERGFALLMVFLMAAVVAMFLYMQLPRVAFESERDKEQLLIDRGEQYKRAIQLYVNAWKKYPQRIEDLENTNNKRYLRRRYIDPMTGKDEWRLIHVNAAGMLTDSLVQKPTTPDGKPADGLATSTTGSTPGNSNSQTATDVNAAVMRRPSDVVGQAYTQAANPDSNDPATWAPITLGPQPGANGTINGQPPSGAVGFNGGLLGQNPAQGQFPGQPGLPGQVPGPGSFPLPGQPGFNPNQNQFKVDANGQLVPFTPTQTAQNGQQGTGAAGSPSQVTAMGPSSAPVGIYAPGINPPGNGPVAQNPATQAINNMLTNPNPVAGANGLGTAGGMTAGGIAGVASNFKGPSIKTYNKRQKYQEWEFVFSLNDQQNLPGQNRNPLQPGQNGLTPGQNGALGTGPGVPGAPGPGTTTTGNP